MRLTAICGLLSALCVSGCVVNMNGGFNAVQGSGNMVTDIRDLPQFDSVLLEGSSNVVITIGDVQAVEVDADDNIVDVITTEVDQGRLVVSSSHNYSTQNEVVVRITIPELKKIGISGSGDVTVTELASPEFEASVAGSGDIIVTGTAGTVTARVAGSGTIDLTQLHASDAVAKIAGSGDIYVCASASITAKIAGSGDVQYSGHSGMSPKVSTSVAGSGDVTQR